MIDIETHDEENIIALKVSGTLNKQDFEALAPRLRDFTESNQNPNLLMVLERFKGWDDVSSFWEDLKLDAEFIGKFQRIAIVGESKWQKWGTNFLNALTNEEMNFFDIKDADRAWFWLQGKTGSL
ncbi:MAG: STAS/SEC14 domain-containing protein [Balneola sp.]